MKQQSVDNICLESNHLTFQLPTHLAMQTPSLTHHDAISIEVSKKYKISE